MGTRFARQQPTGIASTVLPAAVERNAERRRRDWIEPHSPLDIG